MTSSLVEERILRLREGRLCKILVGEHYNQIARVVSIDITTNIAMVALIELESKSDITFPVRFSVDSSLLIINQIV